MQRLLLVCLFVVGCQVPKTEVQEEPAPAPTCDSVGCSTQNRLCVNRLGVLGCGPCAPGFRESSGACVAVKTCADLTCQNRECVAAQGNRDAVCGSCVDGAVEQSGICVMKSCAVGFVPGSLLSQCDAVFRTCENAQCTGCKRGYIDNLGVCEPVATCESLGCVDGKRVCVPPGDNSNASCGACRAGFVEQLGDCVAVAGKDCSPSGANSLLASCQAEHRTCALPGGVAQCGACLAGFVENPATGACEALRTCADLACAAEHRVCTNSPNAACAGCDSGFVEQAGMCRPAVTCGDLTCSPGEVCQPEASGADAYCRADCGGNALWTGDRCEPCPACTSEGEDGRFESSTKSGRCICKTKPGYFYSEGNTIGTLPCDADGDGWVRESARNALESTDPALSGNARCSLRTIDRFVLENEAGTKTTQMLAQPLALYETDRNDDDVLLDSFWQQRGLPKSGAVGFRASELNRLTKFCADARSDYNDNSVPDVEEYGTRELAENFRSEQAPFNLYSYFAELHSGAFLAPSSYVITEKGRALASPKPVPLNYAVSDGTYWRQCTRYRDSQADSDPPVGMDFAASSNMQHHSQFKCLVIDPQPDAAKPEEITATRAQADGYRLNHCERSGSPTNNTANPDEPGFVCTTVLAASATAGDALLAGVPYLDYVGPSGYVRGCINECVLGLPQCPFYNVNPTAVTCQHDVNDFGKFVSCSAFEVCDGLDNNGVGGIDEGDPGGGATCLTGEQGVCSPGVKHCVSGSVQCVRNVNPSPANPALAELLCDGLDNDCDGVVDDGDPQSGGFCNTGNLGICAAGTKHCVAGTTAGTGVYTCTQNQQPSTEVCDSGHNVDEDCNGAADNVDGLAGCVTYYKDNDGDHYGVTTGSRCLCAPEPATKYTATANNDCCDTDAVANPGYAGGYKTSANACNSFDWNCSGAEDKQYTQTATAGCGRCCSGFCCCGANTGWANNALAGCGQTASYHINDCTDWSPCDQESENRTQGCF